MSSNNRAIIFQAITLAIAELQRLYNIEQDAIQEAIESRMDRLRSIYNEHFTVYINGDPELFFTKEEREMIISSPINMRRVKNNGYWTILHSNVPDDFSTGSFRAHYRMSQHSFNFLVETLSQHPAFQLKAHNAIPTYIQVGTVLWRFANCHFGFRMASALLGIGEGSFHNFTERFVDALEDQLGHIVRWPSTSEEFSKIKEEFKYPNGEFGSAKLPNVIGAIDGKLINIHRPPEDSERYRDRKGNLSLNLLAICDSNCRFMYMYTGESGRSHDASVFNSSRLPLMMNNPDRFFPERSYLLGDSAYPLSQFLITPYNQVEAEQDQSKRLFNKTFSAMRSVIERAFGQLVKRWHFLFKYVYMTTIERDIKVITCCIILHNFCKDMDDDYVDIYNSNDTEEIVASLANSSHSSSHVNRQDGVTLRNNLRQLVYTNRLDS